jgi:predicted site-specific integrase-resolvase
VVSQLELMTPAEVSHAFGVDPRTITRWRKAGKLLVIKTPGGHRRYFRLQVDAMRQGRTLTPAQLEILRQAGGRS